MNLNRNYTVCLNYKFNKGISIPEIAVVLALLSFTFYFSIDSFNKITTKSTLENIANELNNILIYARNQAIISNENISVCTTQDNKKCDLVKTTDNKFSWDLNWVVFKDKNNNEVIDKSDILYLVASNKKNINITFNRSNKTTFNNIGKCLKSGTFLIKKNNNPSYYKIIISLSGRIRKQYESEQNN